MTDRQNERQVLEVLRNIAQHSPGHPVQVDTVSRVTGTDVSELQPILNAMFEAGELRELIGDKPISAVVLDD